MTLLTGMRIGQSREELRTAVTFSLVIHIVTISGALLLSMYARPRVFIPPTYHVNLVKLPSDAPLLPPSMSAAPSSAPQDALPPPAAPSAAVQAKHPAPALKTAPAPAAPSQSAMPELDADKQKKRTTAATEQPAGVAEQPQAGATGRKQEGVAVAVMSETPGFSFPPYVAIVRDKVERNWNPPPGAKGATVKVVFRILRSGRVGDARLIESSGNFYFDQAAMRAILSSSPFPPLPEGFFRDYETFSVDLVERD
jgi:TonB family protein